MRKNEKAIVILSCVLIFSLMFPNMAISGSVSQAKLQKIEQQWQTSAHALAEVNCSNTHRIHTFR